MTYRVTVSASDASFACDEGESVLDAAERAGYAIPYSCRKGVCSTCEGGLRSGRANVRGHGSVSGPVDGVLLCQARPTSDVEIAPKRIERRERPIRRTLSATVFRTAEPAPDVTIVQLRFPSGVRVKFRAGQYLRVLMPDGDSRNYSMANPPKENDGAQLHIRRIPGGRFSEGVAAQLAKGDKLRIDLPYGEFVFNQDSDRPAILLATGTGFAPVKSLVEDQIRRASDRPVHLYWGARHREDLYLSDLPQKWSATLPWFSYTPVLSRPAADWDGRTGFVQHFALADYPDLSGHEVYACGSPEMIEAAREILVSAGGLGPENFLSDAFVPSGNAEVFADDATDADEHLQNPAEPSG